MSLSDFATLVAFNVIDIDVKETVRTVISSRMYAVIFN